MSAFAYPPDASAEDRDRIDRLAAEHGEDERDGRHEDYR